jgi:hypothetical protein
MNPANGAGEQSLYLAGYIAALKDVRELLAESDKPPIVALCAALDDKLATLRRRQRGLVRRRRI